MSLRLFNPKTRLWSIYWANSEMVVLDVPQVGRFLMESAAPIVLFGLKRSLPHLKNGSSRTFSLAAITLHDLFTCYFFSITNFIPSLRPTPL